MKPTSVHAFAISEGQANRIVDSLGKSGFSSNHISVLFPDKDTSRVSITGKHIKDLEGGLICTATGGVLGGIIGLLVGIGTLAIPGVGPLLAAGSLLAALSGAATGATVGVAGGLIGFKIPKIRAKCREDRFTKGDILISVVAETGDDVSRARHVLERGFSDDIPVTSVGEIASAYIG